MAEVLTKLTSELAPLTEPYDALYITVEDVVTKDYYYVLRSDLLKDITIVKFEETEHDYGDVAAGTFTHDCDTYSNSGQVTLTGAGVTIEAPTKTLTQTDAMVEGAITIIGGDTFTVSGWGTNWDFGNAGEPTLTSKDVICFKRRIGDTKTIAWYGSGGFSV